MKLKKEIETLKQMYKHLSEYRQVEEDNFKSQFVKLTVSEESRSKLREQLVNYKVRVTEKTLE